MNVMNVFSDERKIRLAAFFLLACGAVLDVHAKEGMPEEAHRASSDAVAKAAIFRTIGGSAGVGPLTVRVGDDHSFQILNSAVPGVGQIFPPNTNDTANMGWIVRAGGVLYSPAFGNSASGLGARTLFMPGSISAVTGAGSTSDPFKVSVVAGLGNSNLVATQDVLYVNGRNYFEKRFSVKNNGTTSQSVKIYLGADIYLAGNDRGVPYRVEATGSVGGQSCNNGSAGNYSILFIPLTRSDYWSAGRFDNIWSQIGSPSNNLPSAFSPVANCSGIIDNGAALQWNRTIGAGETVTIRAATSFGDVPSIAYFNVTTVTPSRLPRGVSTDVTIAGFGFSPDTRFDFGTGVTISNLVFPPNRDDHATARLSVESATPIGSRSVRGSQGGASFAVATLENGVTIVGSEISVRKTAQSPRFSPGGAVSYIIDIINSGNAPANGLVISDTPPAGLNPAWTWACVREEGNISCPRASGTGAINETFPVFPAGAAVSYTVNAVATSDAPATVTNSVSVSPGIGSRCVGTTTATPPCVATAVIQRIARPVISGIAEATLAGKRGWSFRLSNPEAGQPATNVKVAFPASSVGSIAFFPQCTTTAENGANGANGVRCDKPSDMGGISCTQTNVRSCTVASLRNGVSPRFFVEAPLGAAVAAQLSVNGVIVVESHPFQ